MDVERLRAGLSAASLNVAEPVLGGLVDETVEHAIRARAEENAQEQLASADLPSVTLPELTGGIDVAALYELAEVLTTHGVGRTIRRPPHG